MDFLRLFHSMYAMVTQPLCPAPRCLALAALAACSALGAAEPRSIADFDQGISGWSYQGGWEYPGAKGGVRGDADALAIDFDFTGGGSYVGAVARLPERTEAITMGVRAPGIKALLIRFEDANGDWYQQPLPLADAGERWQPVRVVPGDNAKSLSKRSSGFTAPPKSWQVLVARSTAGTRGPGTVWIDDVRQAGAKP